MTPGSLELFPSLRWPCYVNHAAIGPLPQPTLEAVQRVATMQATEGVAAIGPLVQELDTTRSRAATLLGVSAEDVALTTSTSAGIAAVAASIRWQAQDRIVLFRGEFPSNTTPWQQAAERHGLEVVWLEADRFRTEEGLGELEAVLAEGGVRLVAVSAVQFDTGLRMPTTSIAALAHAHGAEVFVDAIQALGAVPFDASTVDYVAAGGQKWLMGPVGSGVLYASRRCWEALEPVLAGWLSHVDPLAFLWGDPDLLVYDRPLQHGPPTVEGGGPNLVGWIGLGASLALHLEVGVHTTFAHANRWLDPVEQALIALGFVSERTPDADHRSAILSLRPPEGVHPGAMVTALAERGVSASSPNAHLRFSPSWPTPLSHADKVIEAVGASLAEVRRG